MGGVGEPDARGSNLVESAPHRSFGCQCGRGGTGGRPHGGARSDGWGAQRAALCSRRGLDVVQRASDRGAVSDS